MKKVMGVLCPIYLFIVFSSCQKPILEQPSQELLGEIVSNDLTLADKVTLLKAGDVPYQKKYSDTIEAARNGFGTALTGNSHFERMLYSNWDLNFPKTWRFINRGIGGTKWSELVPYTNRLVTEYKPSNILLYSGENEYSQNLNKKSPRAIALAGFNTFMDSVRSQNPYARVYVFSMVTPPKFYYRGFAPDIDTLNMEYKKRVESDALKYPGKVFFIDIREYYPSIDRNKWETDSIHIKLSAYPAWYNKIKTTIDTTRIVIPVDTITATPLPTDTIVPSPPGDTIVTTPADTIVMPPPPPPADTIVNPPPPPADTIVTTPPPTPADTIVLPPPPADTIVSLPLPPVDTIVTPPPPPSPVPPVIGQAPIARATNSTGGDTLSVPKSWNYHPYVYGTRSTDTDGYIAAFSWTKVSGPISSLIVSPTAGKTQLQQLVAGTYIFRLTVTDNKGNKSSDDVTVIITSN